MRIAIAEKGIDVERIEVDLQDRPQWLLELNPPDGRVPVLEGMPESVPLMELLEELYPEPKLLPVDEWERARARLLVHRFDESLGNDYYAFRRGDDNDLAGKLERLEVGQSLYADVAYAPWVIRVRELLGVQLPSRVDEWLAELELRDSVRAEVEVVRNL